MSLGSHPIEDVAITSTNHNVHFAFNAGVQKKEINTYSKNLQSPVGDHSDTEPRGH